MAEAIELYRAYDGPAWGRPNGLAEVLFCPCPAHRAHAEAATGWLLWAIGRHRATADAIRLVLDGAVPTPREWRGADLGHLRREIETQTGLGDSYAELLGQWRALALAEAA